MSSLKVFYQKVNRSVIVTYLKTTNIKDYKVSKNVLEIAVENNLNFFAYVDDYNSRVIILSHVSENNSEQICNKIKHSIHN